MTASDNVGLISPPQEVLSSLAVDCTGLGLLALSETSLPEGSPIQPTIDKMCVYADTKKDAGASVSPITTAGS